MNKPLLSLFCLLCLSFSATAQKAPPSDVEMQAGGDIRIYSDKQNTIKEFRASGRVYMIQITPKKGPSYYLVDADGDGDFDTRHNDLSPNLKVPSWVIFSW